MHKELDCAISAYDVLSEFSDYGSEMYDAYQVTFGGMQNIKEVAEGTAKEQKEALDSMYGAFYGNTTEFSNIIDEMQVQTATLNKTMVNAAYAYFDDVAEIQKSYAAVVDSMVSLAPRIDACLASPSSLSRPFIISAFSIAERRVESLIISRRRS